MKKIIILFTLVLLYGSIVVAQEKDQKSGLDVGFQLNQFQNDFGLGITVSSPWLIKEALQLKLRANSMFFEYVEEETTTWQPYLNLMLSSSSGYKPSEFIRLYGEGGVILLLPSNKFSSKETEIGGFGVFGFEFFFDENFTYFFEAGGVGIGANADKIENKPIYSNGFLMSVGFKIKL